MGRVGNRLAAKSTVIDLRDWEPAATQDPELDLREWDIEDEGSGLVSAPRLRPAKRVAEQIFYEDVPTSAARQELTALDLREEPARFFEEIPAPGYYDLPGLQSFNLGRISRKKLLISCLVAVAVVMGIVFGVVQEGGADHGQAAREAQADR